MPFEPGDYRLDIPTASPYEDLDQYIPLMLSAVDGWLDFPSRWMDDDPDGTAHLYMEDLRAFIQDLPLMMVPLGGIMAWPESAAPTNWLLCHGTLLTVADYPELYAVIGERFGFTSTGVNFRLPNLIGRFPLGATEVIEPGDTGGAETVTLTTAQLPSHSHGISTRVSATSGTGERLMRASGAETEVTQTANAGSGQAHNNMPPYLATNFIIRAK